MEEVEFFVRTIDGDMVYNKRFLFKREAIEYRNNKLKNGYESKAFKETKIKELLE